MSCYQMLVTWNKQDVKTTKCTMFWFCWIIHELNRLSQMMFSYTPYNMGNQETSTYQQDTVQGATNYASRFTMTRQGGFMQ